MTDRVPLQYPLYGATFGEAVRRFFRKYAVFSGRASRSEFWWTYLFLSLVYLAVTIVITAIFSVVIGGVVAGAVATTPDGELSPAAISGIIGLCFAFYGGLFVIYLPLLVPTIALAVRRLHDGGFSGWWYLIGLAPFGSIVLLVMCALDSKPEGMRYDPVPPMAPGQPVWGTDPDPSSTIRS